MKTCYILDDQYGEQIFQEMKKIHPDWNFPVQKNILSPLEYLENIVKEQADYILLDNYFPWEYREEAKGDEFLQQFLEKAEQNKNIKTKIICISDYWISLLEKYEYRDIAHKKWYIVWFIPSKSSEDIANYLEKHLENSKKTQKEIFTKVH